MTDSTDLGKHLDDFVDGLVKSGRYENRDAVLKEGLELLEEREKRLSAVDAAIERGIASAEAGRVKPLEEVAARLKAKYAAMTKERAL
jgi:antitoxin ParD1/3/4